MSNTIEQLVALSIASGNRFDASEPGIYEMIEPMPQKVREAGERDASLFYTQTVSKDVPQEGFIDEASETMILFPFSPEAIARAHAEAAAHRITWRGGMAIVLGAAGMALLFRSVTADPFDITRCFVGFCLLAIALLLSRGDRRRKRQLLEK